MPQVISDHTINVKLYINLALCSSWKIVACKPLLEVFSFHMLSAWVKHQIIIINIQGFSQGQKFYGMHRVHSGFKIPFFSMANIFFPIRWSNRISHYVWNVNSLILCKLLILF